jgi:hypothetical protein
MLHTLSLQLLPAPFLLSPDALPLLSDCGKLGTPVPTANLPIRARFTSLDEVARKLQKIFP